MFRCLVLWLEILCPIYVIWQSKVWSSVVILSECTAILYIYILYIYIYINCRTAALEGKLQKALPCSRLLKLFTDCYNSQRSYCVFCQCKAWLSHGVVYKIRVFYDMTSRRLVDTSRTLGVTIYHSIRLHIPKSLKFFLPSVIP